MYVYVCGLVLNMKSILTPFILISVAQVQQQAYGEWCNIPLQQRELLTTKMLFYSIVMNTQDVGCHHFCKRAAIRCKLVAVIIRCIVTVLPLSNILSNIELLVLSNIELLFP